MRNVKKFMAILMSVAVIATSAGCSLITKTPQGIANTVVATVGGDKIIKADFDKKLGIQALMYEGVYGEDFFTSEGGKALYDSQIKPQVLDQMVIEHIIMKKAAEIKVIPDEKTLNEEAKKNYDEYIKAQKDKDKFLASMKAKNLTEEDYLEVFKNNIIHEKVYDYYTKDIKPTDEEIKKYYDDNIYQYTEKPCTMDLSQIVLTKEEDAKKAKERIDKGEKFEDVAKEVSVDSATKEKGGAVGEVGYTSTSYPPEYMKAAIELKEGTVSAPIKTDYGYYIIKANKKTEYPKKSFDTVKKDVTETVTENKKNEKYNEEVSKWEKDTKIKTYPKEL